MKTGIELIAEERQEQIEKHNRTIESDIKNNGAFQLSKAAAALIHPDFRTAKDRFRVMPNEWDDLITLKMCRKSYEDRLVIAGALIAAEIDRINSL